MKAYLSTILNVVVVSLCLGGIVAGLGVPGWRSTLKADTGYYYSVYVDVKPGSCPNALNVGNKGKLPVAIVSSSDFDATDIDVDTIRLQGEAVPDKATIEDVATPYEGMLSDEYSCHDYESDGKLDLNLKFKTKDVADAIGPVFDGDVVVLSISGYTRNGELFQGEDVIIVRKKGRERNAGKTEKERRE
jgi:hypothetical protein